MAAGLSSERRRATRKAASRIGATGIDTVSSALLLSSIQSSLVSSSFVSFIFFSLLSIILPSLTVLRLRGKRVFVAIYLFNRSFFLVAQLLFLHLLLSISLLFSSWWGGIPLEAWKRQEHATRSVCPRDTPASQPAATEAATRIRDSGASFSAVVLPSSSHPPALSPNSGASVSTMLLPSPSPFCRSVTSCPEKRFFFPGLPLSWRCPSS